nr:uncharacterized protein LOC118144105 isoform X2 [Callithrix jacchus]
MHPPAPTVPGPRRSTPSLAFHFAPSDPNPPTPPPDPLESILAREAASSLPIRSNPALPRSVPTPTPSSSLNPSSSSVSSCHARLEPGRDHPGAGAPSRTPAHPQGRRLPSRASPATRAAAVFMRSRVRRPPAAYRRPGPGRAGRLGVTDSPDSQGPGSHGRPTPTRLPHPRAWCGKGDPGRLGTPPPPPPSRPPGYHLLHDEPTDSSSEARGTLKTKPEPWNCSGLFELCDLG